MDEGVHLLNFFFLDELSRVEILDLSSNLRIIAGRIESRDSADPRLSGAQRFPGLLHPDSKRSYQSETGHHHTSGRSIVHTYGSVMPSL